MIKGADKKYLAEPAPPEQTIAYFSRYDGLLATIAVFVCYLECPALLESVSLAHALAFFALFSLVDCSSDGGYQTLSWGCLIISHTYLILSHTCLIFSYRCLTSSFLCCITIVCHSLLISHMLIN